MDKNDCLITIYLSEFEIIKKESQNRIGLRDNLIYFTLLAITGIVSIVVVDINRLPLLLILPLITITLGWTYLINDEKISIISTYVREILAGRVNAIISEGDSHIFGWETYYRTKKVRILMKILQLVINESLFVLSSIFGIFTIWKISPKTFYDLWWIIVIEIILIIFLGFLFVINSDIKK